MDVVDTAYKIQFISSAASSKFHCGRKGLSQEPQSRNLLSVRFSQSALIPGFWVELNFTWWSVGATHDCGDFF